MEAAKKIFCMGLALFKATDKSMNDAHYSEFGENKSGFVKQDS